MPNRQLSLGPMEVNASDSPEQSLDREGHCSLTSMLVDAIEETHCPEKVAARDMGYDPAYLSRIKAGEKAAHLDRVGRLPVKVQQEFVKRYARELKLDVRDVDERERALADLACAVANAARVF